jgi:hypothetical protein
MHGSVTLLGNQRCLSSAIDVNPRKIMTLSDWRDLIGSPMCARHLAKKHRFTGNLFESLDSMHFQADERWR